MLQRAALPLLAAPSTSVHARVRGAHFGRPLARGFDLHQFSFSDSRAPRRGLLPFALAFHQLGPERKRTALHRLDGVNGAASVTQEMALLLARDAQAQQILGAIDVAPFKLTRRKPQVLRDTSEIAIRQVNETLLLAAGGTTRLAFESQYLH